MPSTRQILRVFLASPGDLQEERKAIRDVVTQFNRDWADYLGYHVELVGWEETIAGYGRPQQLINQDLDQCDLFIGMISKRWGTPPDHEGDYTSGFHEEFELSIARRERTQNPEISLFFKQIPDEFMADPGEDLKKVLNFREKIVADKKIFFREFATVRDIEVLARECMTAYVIRVKTAEESSEPHEVRAKRAESTSGNADAAARNPEPSPLVAEGFVFLKDLVERMEQAAGIEDLSAPEIARFRLLANSISKPGNQDMDLGVHDINLLYLAHSNGIELERREFRFLTKLGFQHLNAENVPLWRWYSVLSDSPNTAVVSSFPGASDDERVGAITVLDALSLDLPTTDEFLTRDWILDVWFSEDTSPRVRSAALGYLAKNGTAEDYPIAKKEYNRSDHGTSRGALECMARILLRTGQKNAAQLLILESQFESLDIDTLQAVLEDADTLDTETLLRGLEHRSAHVRRWSLNVLRTRGSIDEVTAERLCQDTDASIRNDAISALAELGRQLTEEEVKEILTRPQKQPGALIDPTGRELFARYRLERLRTQSEEALAEQVDNSTLYDDDPYFARAEEFFPKHAKELRRDVDDTFRAYVEERFRRARKIFGETVGETIVESFSKVADYTRKELTRQALDILCRRGEPEDLDRIRKNLQSGYAGASKADAEYLGRRGEWKDIALLGNAYRPPFLGGSIITGEPDFRDELVRAILEISRQHSVSALFALEIPETVLRSAIDLCPESRFSKISHDVLLGLFDHESADVRHAAAIKTVRTLPAKRIESILKEYLGRDKRYYNVIHWLDLGTSMSRDAALKVVIAMSRNP